MTRYSSYAAIRGSKPWGDNPGGVEQAPREAEPQQQAVYHCGGNRGRPCTHPRGTFTLTFAAKAEPPLDVDCRCGGPARLEGAPDDIPVQPAFYHYHNGSGGSLRGKPRDDITPQGQLRKRRSDADGQQILAEALAELKQQRGEMA